MTFLYRALVVIATASAISFPSQTNNTSTAKDSTARRRPTTMQPAPPTTTTYAVNQLEYYLTDDGIAYIRPGLKVKVDSITIGTDGKPVVEVTFTDSLDNRLDRLGKTTPGAISASFILASYDPVTRKYNSHTTRTVKSPATSPVPNNEVKQASADSGGTWTDLETGRARYKFNTAVPADHDVTKTHTLGIYSTRNLTAIIGKNYYANVEHNFRPDGVAMTEKWDKINDTTSCLNCHDPLQMHGGSRRDVKLCVLCHSPQTVDPDTGNSVDMAFMTHKIHFGEGLTKGYTIIGNQGSVHDYSEIVIPQDVRNCQNCHVGTNASAKPTQADLYLTKPSRNACGACHDDVDWVTGANHVAGPQTDDSACASCHIPDSGEEFDASIKGAHTIPTKSKQLKGLKAEIVSVKDVGPGLKPTITFKVTNGDGTAVDASKLSTFSPIHAGPTSSYKIYYRETGAGKGVFDATTGTTSYTFTNPIPADATGTWSFSADIYRSNTLKRADGKPDITNVREAVINPQKYIALDGGTAQPRRTAVSMALCNKCHDSLGLHGGQRRTIEECVMCHNPVKDDTNQRVAGTGLPESVSFQRLIHRIHSGHELTQDFTVYGNNKSVHNYNHVGYPGDRRNCNSCHVGDSQQVPPAKGAAPVITQRDYFSPQGPGTASCLGCHDSQDAAAHAYLNTTNFGGTSTAEACGTCHGKNSEWAVDKVHAR